MFRRRHTSMNNERYHRVHADEHAHADDVNGNNDNDNEMVSDKERSKYVWGNKFHMVNTTDDDDRNDGIDDIGDDDIGGAMTFPTSPNGNGGEDFPRVLSTTSSLASSFDLDDDEDGDLQKFKLDFSNDSNLDRLRTSLEFERGKITIQLLIKAFKQTQEETRRKRVEKLLSLEDDRMQYAKITILSWCNIYDRGLILFILVMLIWFITASVVLRNILWTCLGVLFTMARLSFKPGYWYFYGRHEARKRKATMDLYDELNQVGMELQLSSNSPPSSPAFNSRNNSQANSRNNSMHGSIAQSLSLEEQQQRQEEEEHLDPQIV